MVYAVSEVMTEINHNLVKQQMIDIIQNNPTLYDINDETKLTYAEVGIPDGNPLPTPPTYPALLITNSRTLETINRKGIISSNQHTYLTHDVNYLITFIVNQRDSIEAERILDEFQKLIMETLEADILLDTGSQTLPISPDDSWPDRVETFRQENDGQPIRGKTITWHFKFVTN